MDLTGNDWNMLAMYASMSYEETPARIEAILKHVKQLQWKVFSPLDHGWTPIEQVHKAEYIEYIKRAYHDWLKLKGNPDGVFPDGSAVREFGNLRRQKTISSISAVNPTTVIVEGTPVAAYQACQVALTAADILMTEGDSAVFALTRPPGHHAHPDICAGYCFFNNVAVVVEYLITQYKQKVAIIDIDYHHGNGTQDIFYTRKNPLYISIHGLPDYPYYWGASSETGEGDGEGYNINHPLPLGSQDPEYVEALKTVLSRLDNPDVIVVSLGVDTFKEDPIGGFFLTTEGYFKIGQCLAASNVKKCLFVMEGGYNIEHIGVNVTSVLRGYEDGLNLI
ncbi:hypothetical protein SmJEL517_g04212 [Synchytrium microbalum]|uniref:Histone deacetylase domain-containing protein n=1 Tax=Synchytrium microbalum TaxID=1806994 RepID=A0A507C3Q8_9FUNG|nr:uncharacterized protein SmJEL517_g04212 [Synchytrium microbalum]TPX32744.1 hypothetical protein SmJEL517_g04212 [Synchytrium microbalum]